MKKSRENKIKFLATTVELTTGRKIVFYADRIKIYSADTSMFMELSLEELGEIITLTRPVKKSKETKSE